MDRLSTLQNSTIFNHLNTQELESIASIASEQKFQKGSVILAENMGSMALYIVMEGSVEIIKKIGLEKDKNLTTLMPGECFGELSLFDDAPHSATVKSAEDSCLIVIEKRKFNDLIEQDPALGIKILKKLLKILSFRLRQSNEQMLNIMAWSLDSQQLK
ncbi:MAG: cyclic nucleotide-binding domain-containing protein [bacterium]